MMQYPLTDVKIRKMKPDASGRFEVWDAKFPGFGMRVSPTGTKSFVLLYRQNGRARRKTLGRYPALSLGEARLMAKELLNQLTHGQTPELAEQKEVVKVLRFDACVAEFALKHCSRHNKPQTARETERLLRQHFVSRWAARDVREISRQQVIAVLDKLVERGVGSTSNHALSAIRKFFNWCVERGIVEVSPCAGVKAPARNISRSRVLSDKELALVWQGVEVQGFPFRDIVHLLILTGQRRSEIGEMRWEDIDLGECLWSIPAERNKSNRPHSVPLIGKTLEIIKSVPRRPSPFLFPSLRSPERVFSGYSKCKKRLDEQSGVSDWRIHDLRRSVATGMARLQVQPHVVERLLNHSSGTFSGVAGVYNRFGYLPEMREALEKWENHVNSLIKLEVM